MNIASIASGAAQAALDPNPLDKLKGAAQAFEAVFARQMIKSMRSASLGDGLFESNATEQFRDMSDANLADSMATKGSLGIADLLIKQFGATVQPVAGADAAASANNETKK